MSVAIVIFAVTDFGSGSNLVKALRPPSGEKTDAMSSFAVASIECGSRAFVTDLLCARIALFVAAEALKAKELGCIFGAVVVGLAGAFGCLPTTRESNPTKQGKVEQSVA